MKRFDRIFSLLIVFFFSTFQLQAGSTTTTATKDLFVSQTSGTNSDYLFIQNQYDPNSGAGAATKHAVIQFNKQTSHTIDAANLLLDVVFQYEGSATYLVWGVKDGAWEEDFDEDNLSYSDWEFNSNQNEGIWSQSSELGVYEASPDLHDVVPSNGFVEWLGDFSIEGVGGINQTLSISSNELLDFLNDDTNGIVTLVITGFGDIYSLNGEYLVLASSENDSYSGPRLVLEAEDKEIAATDDVFVRYNDTTNYGSDSHINVKNRPGQDGTERKGFLEFDIGNGGDYMSVELMLDVSIFSGASSMEFHVFGIQDNDATEDLDEANALYTDFPYLDGSGDGVENNSDAFYNDGVKLGSFIVTDADLNKTVAFSSDALNNMIDDDTNGKITLLITRNQTSNSMNSAFASTEHATLNPPRLYLRPNLVADTETVDMEITYSDVDGDGNPEMVLVLNNPGGGGTVVADPFAIADHLITIGYGLGSDTDFFDILSPTQQSGLLDAFEAVEVSQDCFSTASVSEVSADDLNDMFANITIAREYPVVTFDTRADLVTDLDSGGIELEASYSSCTLLEITLGNFSVTIDGPSAQAAMTITDDRITVGAEASLWTATVSASSDNGSSIGISGGASIGGVYDITYGDNGVYGATFPISANLTLSVYVSATDAENAYNKVMYAYNKTQDQFETWLGSEFYDELNQLGIMEDIDVIYQVHEAYDMVVNIERTSDEAYIFIKQQGQETLIVLEGTASDISADILDAFDEIGDFYNGFTTDLVGDINNWANTVAGTAAAVYTTAVDWVEDEISNIGNAIKKGLKKLFG